jgi:hypothetical protein
MYKVIKTNDGYMIENQYGSEYAHDENGDNCFDSIDEAQKMLFIARVRDAIDHLYEAIEEGDAETVAHLALRYKQLFGNREMSK